MALHQAAADCRRWQAAGLQPVHVAVNCSPLQLRRPGSTEQVLDIVAGWTGGGWGLDLEITENLLVDPTVCPQTGPVPASYQPSSDLRGPSI